MADGELKKGGLFGAGLGMILGGIAIGAIAVVSAPVTAPAAALIVLGTAAVLVQSPAHRPESSHICLAAVFVTVLETSFPAYNVLHKLRFLYG